MKIDGVSGIDYLSGFGEDNGSGSTNVITSFSDYMKGALDKTNDLQIESSQITNDFAAGKTDNIHQVMIAAEKADIALQFTMQVRNKVLDAYNEIMRMQV